MESGDWVISIVIGVFGIMVVYTLADVEQVIVREVSRLRADLEKITDKTEKIEFHLAAIRNEVSRVDERRDSDKWWE